MEDDNNMFIEMMDTAAVWDLCEQNKYMAVSSPDIISMVVIIYIELVIGK